MEPKVTIYSKGYCPYCDAAKAFFKGLGVPFEEVDVTNDEPAYDALKKRTGHRTVPQIFIGEKFIGGYNELMKAHGEGKILPLLGK